MKAVVKEVKTGVRLKDKYDVAVLAVIDEEKNETRTYNVFTGTELYNKVIQLSPNDYVDLKFERKGKYWNLSDVSMLSRSTGGGHTQATRANQTQEQIARMNSLNVTVNALVGLLAHGSHFKKTISPELFIDEVVRQAPKVFVYITGIEDDPELGVTAASDLPDVPF
jgi:hypothetical protein